MNEFFEKVLRRYDIKDARDKQNAIYEITQQVCWQDFIVAVSLTMPLSMEVLACACFISCLAFQRTWISP